MEFLKRKQWDTKIFEEIMPNFPNLTKTINLTRQTNTSIKKHTHTNIRNKKKATKSTSKSNDQQKILRAARESKKEKEKKDIEEPR